MKKQRLDMFKQNLDYFLGNSEVIERIRMTVDFHDVCDEVDNEST